MKSKKAGGQAGQMGGASRLQQCDHGAVQESPQEFLALNILPSTLQTWIITTIALSSMEIHYLRRMIWYAARIPRPGTNSR